MLLNCCWLNQLFLLARWIASHGDIWWLATTRRPCISRMTAIISEFAVSRKATRFYANSILSIFLCFSALNTMFVVTYTSVGCNISSRCTE
ncbi:unnamed protein product [Musa acuminata subsp. malaccensis]|uniref:(wild Malaysian banana) hypothetical protein n=1 Tax=Musa acuminata subsp. malaccensis TaxID=214687 RepID=A0A804HP64_MUSAM|nr:unnamed protein product [Musa acuminata subsp. malaccensis]